VGSGISDKNIYLSTNGVHLNIVIPKDNIDSTLLAGLQRNENENYLSFGWGDENFYLNTPNWSDLTLKNAFRALFLKSSTLMHVKRYESKQANWIKIDVNKSQLNKLNSFLQNSFKTKENGMKVILENQGYTSMDNFYKAKGSYSCFYTSNSWANKAFKKSGLKSCYWTPFDFGLINKYKG
jgi:uncharacterized protein (TIGR02117 family)